MDPHEVSWPTLTEEFHRRETSVIYAALSARGLAEHSSHADIAAAFRDPRMWVKAFSAPEQAVLFAYGLFAWGMKEWEYTIDHDTVKSELDAAATALSEARSDIESHSDSAAVELILALADSLRTCMALENTLYSSCLSAFNDMCEGLIRDYEAFGDALSGLRGLSDPIGTCLREIIDTQMCFYQGLTNFGAAALDYRDDLITPESHMAALTGLDEAIAELKQLGPDVLASDLLPYTLVLKTLGERSTNVHLPRVRFDDIKFIYIFPFTIDGIYGEDIYKKLKPTPSDTRAGSLNGIVPRSVLPADLTDLWQWHGFKPSMNDDSNNPEYAAIDIEMPDVTVTTEDFTEISDYRVKIRITTRGNHYVRIEKSLRSPTLSDINQGLRRASNLMYEPTVTCEGIDAPRRLRNLAGYAKAVVSGVYELFTSPEFEPSSRSKNEILSDIDVHFHVALEIRAASVYADDGWKDATQDDIADFAGPLLLQPLTRMAVAPEEWVCYKTAEWSNILKRDSFAVDFAVGTTNTTVLSMPAAPDWFYNSYEECIELVASFVSLVGQWTHEIREASEFAKSRMASAKELEGRAGDVFASDAARERVTEFAAILHHLHDTIVDIRNRRMFLTPSELLGSGHHLAFMEGLFDISRISDKLRDLDSQLRIAELVHDRAIEHQQRLIEDELRAAEEMRDDRERRFGRTTSYLLIAIGSFALAGVVEMFDHQIFGDKEHLMDKSFHPGWHLAAAVIIYLVALYAAIEWVHRQSRASGAKGGHRWLIARLLSRAEP